MGAPQIIYIALLGISLGITAAKHGEPQPNYNFWSSLISTGLAVGLMIWGGFFG